MNIFAFIRDATGRNKSIYQLDKETMIIPVEKISDYKVMAYYVRLAAMVEEAMDTGFARKCDNWESWHGKRCSGYCEVKEQCEAMMINAVKAEYAMSNK